MRRDPSQSVNFRVSRETAGRMLGDASALRSLLAVVEKRQRCVGSATRVPLDIAGAMVDAHIEELTEPGLSSAAAYTLRTEARCSVVVAALHYVATRDCPPYVSAPGEPDDLEILRWATDVVRGCPVG